MFDTLGLTVTRFFEEIPESALRQLIEPDVVSILDNICQGHAGEEILRRVAPTIVDLETLLLSNKTRNDILILLSDKKRAELEIRVGRKIGDSSGNNWSDAEIREVRDFFGLVDERLAEFADSAEDVVAPSYGLFDHQRHAVQKVVPLLLEGDQRTILHLPTGVGKTRSAMHIAARILNRQEPAVVVWLASGKELLEQAVSEFKIAWSHLGNRHVKIGSMWSNKALNTENFSDGFLAIGLAKAWAKKSRSDQGWAVRLSQKVKLVIFDEAHQSIANTYKQLVNDLTISYQCSLLGLTATPGRTWNDIDKDGQLAEFFCHNKVTLEVPGENPIEYLIDNGFLARPVFRTLFASSGMALNDKEVKRIANTLDIPSDIADTLSMSEQYVIAVLSAVESLVKKQHRRILVFAATVRHARVIAAILNVREIRSCLVTGTTPKRERERTIRSFKANDDAPMVLVNFGVLTTGFDAPGASAVVIARPTHSLVQYSQMVGRAIRGPKAGGTESCEILTVVDPRLPGFGDVAEAFLNWEDVWQ